MTDQPILGLVELGLACVWAGTRTGNNNSLQSRGWIFRQELSYLQGVGPNM